MTQRARNWLDHCDDIKTSLTTEFIQQQDPPKHPLTLALKLQHIIQEEGIKMEFKFMDYLEGAVLLLCGTA